MFLLYFLKVYFMSVQIINDANFADMTASGLVLVDFWAEWCGPCKMMLPRLDELANQIGGEATIAKYNVDEGGEVAQYFRIMSIPTIILFKNGQPVEKWIGVQEVGTLADAIRKHAA